MNCYRISPACLPPGTLLLAEWNERTHLVRVEDGILESLQPLARGSELVLTDPVTRRRLDRLVIGDAVPCPAKEPRGLVVWFTGLSGSGKSTLCRMLAAALAGRGTSVHVLDGDEMRRTICRGLGYSKPDRDENIRRIGFLAASLVRRGEVALVAAISPYRATREEVRQCAGRFIEVWVNAPLEVCEQRDAKGLYAAARAGRLDHFTGVHDPYEPPLHAEVECRTDRDSPEQCLDQVLCAVEAAGILRG